jgi:hypothetical protein
MRCLVRKAVLGMMAAHRFAEHGMVGGGQTAADKDKLAKNVEQYKVEAERVGCL